MMKKTIWISILLILSLKVVGQYDKTFWFVAPKVIHFNTNYPLVFRVTAYDKDATVSVSMPANNGFNTITKLVRSNTQEKFEFTINELENFPVNTVNDKGILIESNENVTVYYEITDPPNPDKFTLKGEEALGTHFLIPSQNEYENHPAYNPVPTEKVDIVATEDGTDVTIIPKGIVYGHAQGVPFTIKLDRGQAYCIESRDISVSGTMAGTEITSNKDIAVTISDDLLKDGPPHDVVGDQLVPVSVIGTEYIAVRGNSHSYGKHKVFVLATVDNTYVYLNNDNTLVKQLNKGDLVSYDIIDESIYIKSTHPVYAYQVSGLYSSVNKGNELGSALLPSITCTGSSAVSFSRIFMESFWVQFLVKQDALGGFALKDANNNIVNGSGFNINNLTWTKVPGTDTGASSDTWYSATTNLNVSTNSVYTVENTLGLFHMAIMDENGGSLSYGYFSGYGNMNVVGPTQACHGNTVVLSTSEKLRSYEWFSELDPSIVISNNETISVTKSGKYWVTGIADVGGCEITDSLVVDFKIPDVTLGNDTTVCPGETVSYSLPTGYSAYNWSNSSTNNTASVTVNQGYSGKLSVNVTDNFGCTNSNEVQISAFSVSSLSLNSTSVCKGDRIIATSGFNKYVWEFQSTRINADDTHNFIEPTQSGVYSLIVTTANGCEVQQDFNITVNEPPLFTLNDVFACDKQSYRVVGPNGTGYSYEWNTGATTSYLDLTAPTSFSLKVTDANGCEHTENANFDWYQPSIIDLGQDREECAGITLDFVNSNTFTNFEWIYRKDALSPEIILPTQNPEYRYEITNSKSGDSGMYGVRALDSNGCPVSDDVKVTFYDTNPPVLQITESLCAGTTIEITASNGYDSYKWTKDGNLLTTSPNQNIITIDKGGKYEVEAMYKACIKTNQITVTEHNSPTVDITDDFSFCKGTVTNISVNNFIGDAGAAFDYLIWENEPKKERDWTTTVYEVENAGSYSVTAYDQYGCSATDMVTVSEYAKSVLELGAKKESCEGVNVTLSNPLVGAINYEWYKIEATNDVIGPKNADWSVNQSGSYRIDLLDVNGCEEKDTVVVSMLPTPLLDLGLDIEICQGEVAAISPGGNFDVYQWNNDPLQNTSSIEVNTAGVYDLEVTNSYGCSSSDDVEVIVHSSMQFDIPDRSVCAGEEVVLSVPSGITNYTWSTRATTPNITVGKGKYWLDVANANGCTSSDTAIVNWHPIPNVTLGADTTICPLEYLTLDAGPGYASYQWQNGSTDQTIVAEIMETVNLVRVSNSYGCYGFDTKTVSHEDASAIELFSDTSICASNTLELDAGDGYLSYLWNDGDTQQLKEITEAGEYSVEVNDGCYIIRDTAEVTHLNEPLIAHIDSTNYAQVIISVQEGTEPYKYSLNNSTFQEVGVFNNLVNGDYEVMVEDGNGCIAMTNFSLNNIYEIVVPPFFTPNNDGANDVWIIDGLDRFPNSVVIIYDRYGKIVSKFVTPEISGWDGTYLGKPLPVDDYWYVIKLRNINKTLKGHITLKR